MTDEDQQAENPFEDPRTHPEYGPTIIALEQQIAGAEQRLASLNRIRREDDPVYAFDPQLRTLARIEAIASVLVSAGIMDFVEFTGEHLSREAELMDRALQFFEADKRQRASGIVLPPGRNGRPG